MANRSAQYTQADVTRALKAALSAGMKVREVIASSEGVRLIFDDPNDKAANNGKSEDTWADVQ